MILLVSYCCLPDISFYKTTTIIQICHSFGFFLFKGTFNDTFNSVTGRTGTVGINEPAIGINKEEFRNCTDVDLPVEIPTVWLLVS